MNLTEMITRTEAACEFIPAGAEITLEAVADGITLTRKPEVGMGFEHADFKVRGKYTPLRIVKITGGVIVAHDVNETNPWAPSIYYFGKGFDVFREGEIQWL